MININAGTIYGFTTSLLLSRYDKPKPIPEFHLELWDLCCSQDPWIAIAAPRGHAKSTAITHAYTLGMVLFKQRDFVLIVSDTEGQAVMFLNDIKKQLQDNEELIALFGIKKFRKDTESDIIVEFNTGEQFRIIAKGSEQRVRGLIWGNKRPNLIVGDDLENDEIVMNDDRRKKFRDWFDNALVPCGSDDCVIRIVGTILHMDSMLERKMPAWGKDTTLTDGIKYWTTETDKPWTSVRFRAHNEDFSKILWPEKFPQERLEKLRANYIANGNPEGYSQEYLNYPIDEENAFFRKEDFLPLDDSDPNEGLEYYVGGDLAISEKDRTAFTVFVVAALNSKGILKIVEVIRFRGDSLEIMDELFRLHLKYKPQAFFLEKENIMRSIWPALEQEKHKRQLYPNISEDYLIIPSQDKIKRAQSVRARGRAGGVEVDMEASWYQDFITEMLQFPRSVYKDQVDAWAMIGLGLDRMNDVPTRIEQIEDDFEEEYSFGIGAGWGGSRNFVTGY